ncbi:hypothetical protein SDC49_14515 [Lactobacillus sp. R2/2]|nr:hypothetical protein [Lactobacillus sp. R2/2]MEB3364410.1 hypothetical protein [Lactobacillus sp. R2/2]
MNGLINDVIYKHQKVLTEFLDPGERDILKSWLEMKFACKALVAI